MLYYIFVYNIYQYIGALFFIRFIFKPVLKPRFRGRKFPRDTTDGI